MCVQGKLVSKMPEVTKIQMVIEVIKVLVHKVFNKSKFKIACYKRKLSNERHKTLQDHAII